MSLYQPDIDNKSKRILRKIVDWERVYWWQSTFRWYEEGETVGHMQQTETT